MKLQLPPYFILNNSLFILRCQPAQYIQLLYESGSKTGILVPRAGIEPMVRTYFSSPQRTGRPPAALARGLARPNTFFQNS